jgi:hypothetical protein
VGGRRAATQAEVMQAEKLLFASHSGVAGINFGQYDAIPVECKGPGASAVAPLQSFTGLEGKLPAFVFHNLQQMKYASPTPIQRYSIPCALGIGLDAPVDIMACAQTGRCEKKRN